MPVSATSSGKTKSVSVGVSATGTSGVWYEFDPTDYSSLTEIFDLPNVQDYSTASRKSLRTGLTTPYGGTKAIRVDVGPSFGGSAKGIWLHYPDAHSEKPKEMWLEWYVSFDPNWDIGTLEQPDHKTWLQDDYSAYYREEVPGYEGNSVRWYYKIGNLGGRKATTIAIQDDPEDWPTSVNYENVPEAQTPEGLRAKVWDGKWHRLRIYMKQPSESDVAPNGTGAIAAWLDGWYLGGNFSIGSKYRKNDRYFVATKMTDITNTSFQYDTYYYIGRLRASRLVSKMASS